MEKISLRDFETLLDYSHPFSISLYFSSDEVGLEPIKRKAEFQDIEREVLNQLEQMSASEKEIKKITRALREIKESDELWDIGPKGFAAFISPEMSTFFQLPMSVKNLVSISYRYHLKPLIQLVTHPCDFTLLALSKDSVRLFKGDRYGLEKVTVPDLPKSLEEVVGTETGERNLQFHTRTKTPNGAGRPAIFHGESSWKDDKHKYLERYLHAVDAAVEKYLRESNTPLLLAGVERMITTYCDVNSYHHLVKDVHMKGNIDLLSLDEVHAEALSLIEPFFIEQEKAVVEKCLSHGDPGQFSLDIEEILKQARMGRVDTLLVAQGVRQWGQFNPDSLSVRHFAEPVPESHDLLDIACVETLKNGGRAFVLPPEEIPQHKYAVAVFRY